MTKRGILIFIGVYLGCLLMAVILRIDHFPLTWAPMYSAVMSSDEYIVSAMDKKTVKDQGYLAKHRDGTYSNVTHKDVNIPFRSFWRIYSQRTYGIGPQVHRFGLNEHGLYNVIERDWNRRLFTTINRTLGYEESDPKYIVELTATKFYLKFSEVKIAPVLSETIYDTLTVQVGKSQPDLLQRRPYLLKITE